MLELIGFSLFGASLGLIAGIVLSKKLGLSPSSRELARALEANESYYKDRINRMKGLIKEYEQPTELQQLAHRGKDSGDLVNMFINQLAGIKSLPTWIRPLIPAISGWAKENPQQIEALMAKFLTPNKATGSQGFKPDDYL